MPPPPDILLPALSSPPHDWEQRREELECIAVLYEQLALRWEKDELCELWTDEYADEMAHRCWEISIEAHTELLRMARAREAC